MAKKLVFGPYFDPLAQILAPKKFFSGIYLY